MSTTLDDLVSANMRARIRLQRVINERSQGTNATDLCQTLGHLAFWDEFYATRWDLRKSGNLAALSGLGSALVDSINAAGSPLWRSLDLQTAAGIALRAAERVDDIVASLSGELVTEAETTGAHRLLERALHRNEHCDELDQRRRG